MSQENVDSVINAYNRSNAGGRVPQLDFWHEDAELRAAREDPDSQTHRGIEEIRAQFAGWYEAYPDLRVEVQEAKSIGDHVFAWVRFTGRGAGSGVPVDVELAHVWTLRGGKAARLVEYFDRAEALEAVGLSE
jgi:ketosteroid isomerase-like protein